MMALGACGPTSPICEILDKIFKPFYVIKV